MPLILRMRFTGAEGDPKCAVIDSASLLWGTTKDVFSAGNDEINETGLDYGCLQFCFQQSAGYSTRPEIDVELGAVGHLFLYENIADL